MNWTGPAAPFETPSVPLPSAAILMIALFARVRPARNDTVLATGTPKER